MKGHFVFKTLVCGCLMQMKMCSADSDSRVGEATWKELVTSVTVGGGASASIL